MTRSVLVLILICAAATGCRVLAPGASGPPGTDQPAESLGATPTSAPTVAIAPSNRPGGSPGDACSLGFGVAEHLYPGLRQFARLSAGVAIAEVTSVGDLQYSTETGDRPSCEYIEEAQAVFEVGHMVELRVQAPVAGRGRPGETLNYLFPGGRIGEDASPGHHYGVQLPAVGDRMLVMLVEPPIDLDPGDGVLETDVLELFEIANGRVVTPDPGERVTVEDVRDVVRPAFPSAAPDA